MHILHVTPYFPPTWAYGGIPRIVDGLSRAQYKTGHTISVLTTDVFDKNRRNRLPLFRSEENINIINLPNLSNRLAYKQIFLPLRSQVLSKTPVPDIIHLHGHRHLLNTIAYRYAKKRNIPMVMTTNGTLHRHERRQRIKRVWDVLFSRPIIQYIDQYIAVSPFDVYIHKREGIPSTKTAMIPNGLDLGEFYPLPHPNLFRTRHKLDKRPIIAYLGQLSPRKGVLHLIEACAPMTSVQLIIAGNDMGIGKQVQKAIQAHDHIQCVGLLEGADRVQLLRDSSILVYPSTNEIFGLSPFEGLLCGAPAIVSDDCGCGQLIDKAQAGLLVRYGDSQDIREKIRQLLHDSELRINMVQRGRRYIADHLSFTKVAQQHIELYQRVVQNQ